MFGRLILLLALVGALLWFLHWFRHTPPERVTKVLRRVLLWGAVGLLVLLASSGRLHPLFAALPAVVPLLIRAVNLLRLIPMLRQIMQSLGRFGLPGVGSDVGPDLGGRTSSIRTRFLVMTLDHASGEMDGSVLEGPLRGHRLSALSREQLLDLLALCRNEDTQSVAVLEAYLDRVRGDDWRAHASGAGDVPPAADAAMTQEEALAILGLAPGASEDNIRTAHRRLIQRFHPDRGGSDYLAAKINAAKRLLLGE